MEKILSVGAERLAAIAAARGRGAQIRIAAELGCAQPLVSRWLSGERKPERHWAGKVYELYGIPFDAWDQDGTGKAASHV